MTALLLLAGALLAYPQSTPAAAEPAPMVQGVRPAQAPPPGVVEETLIDRQTREVASQLRCVVCQGLSLQDSPSTLAQDMRAIVREKLEEGMTPAEVKAFFVQNYGEWVLLEPEPRGFNLIVYVLPIMMLFGGAAFVFFKARSWTRQAPAEEEVAA